MSHLSLCELPNAFGAFTNVAFATSVWCFGGIPLAFHWTWWVFSNCDCKHSLHMLLSFHMKTTQESEINNLGSLVLTAICILVALLELPSVTEEPITKPGFTLYSDFSTKKYPVFESKSRFVMIKIMPVVPSKPIMEEKEEALPSALLEFEFSLPIWT